MREPLLTATGEARQSKPAGCLMTASETRGQPLRFDVSALIIHKMHAVTS